MSSEKFMQELRSELMAAAERLGRERVQRRNAIMRLITRVLGREHR